MASDERRRRHPRGTFMIGYFDAFTFGPPPAAPVPPAPPPPPPPLPAEPTSTDSDFWVSASRVIGDPLREVLEVSFTTPRLVNQIHMLISRFPCETTVVYLADDGTWQPVHYVVDPTIKDPAYVSPVVKATIRDSVPQIIGNVTNSVQHPQHFGLNHWEQIEWRTVPFTTAKIRVLLHRNVIGVAPFLTQDIVSVRQLVFNGKAVPSNLYDSATPTKYSLAVKDLRFGYTVTSREEIPNNDDVFATSRDILGSQVVYSLYEQPAASLIDNDHETYWRSEPQPFSFAVVNTYLDLRDGTGSAPVIDSFFIDPVTVGVACTVYYCDDEPDGDFKGDTTPIPMASQTIVGSPGKSLTPATQVPYSITLGPTLAANVQIPNSAIQMTYNDPWWVGINAQALVDGSSSAGTHPIISIGSVQIRQRNNFMEIITETGEACSVPLDPNTHRANVFYRVVGSFHPADPASGLPAKIRIAYSIVGDGRPTLTAEVSVAKALPETSPIWIGHAPSNMSSAIPAVGILGISVKAESSDDITEAGFIEAADDLIAEPQFAGIEQARNQNALLRMHPSFYNQDSNPFGLVGGPGDKFSAMEWTPITRDYTLRLGHMHFPPTKAKFWKFEMTNLLPTLYENPMTIDRSVLVFPADVVARWDAVSGGNSSSSIPTGVLANGQSNVQISYLDMLTIASNGTPSDATSVLIVKDPAAASAIAKTGWIWTYQPWHIGQGAPQFIEKQRHSYEALRIRHSAKTAYFAGIREITPYRTDYTFEDDTPEYVEPFLDDKYIANTSNIIFDPDGGVYSVGSYASFESPGLQSYRTIRGVQFASQESDSYQVFEDPLFQGSRLGDRVVEYGDASIDQDPDDGHLIIRRGWKPNSWGDLGLTTYTGLEAKAWGNLEGNLNSDGSVDGGLTTKPFNPSGAGPITVSVSIASDTPLSTPIQVEILSSLTGGVVASSEVQVYGDNAREVRVTFTPGTLTTKRTWLQIEDFNNTLAIEAGSATGQPAATWGTLESKTYTGLESAHVDTNLFVRVRQSAASSDTFHVYKIAIYDEPIAWFFSNDNGGHWWQAVDVRNNPQGVLIFPTLASANPTDNPGRMLKWRAQIYKDGANISSLNVRPWYGSRSSSVPTPHGLGISGPTLSSHDDHPPLALHPMWRPHRTLIENDFEYVEPIPFWRNMVLNPQGEINFHINESWQGTNATVSLAQLWARGPKFGNAVVTWQCTTTTVNSKTQMILNGSVASAFPIDLVNDQVSAAVFVDSATTVWIQPVASLGVVNAGGTTFTELISNPFPATKITGGGWQRLAFNLDTSASNCTHWRVVFNVYKDNAGVMDIVNPPALSTIVAFDGAYVPSNGLDLDSNHQPYLDGDQSIGIWEGEVHHSTSIYGTHQNTVPTIYLGENLSITSGGTP